MAKREEKQKKSFRGLVLKLVLAVVALYLVVSFISGQMQLAVKQRELEELNAKVGLQAQENKELDRMIQEDDDAAYIERMAREKLGYARVHERVFVDLTGE